MLYIYVHGSLFHVATYFLFGRLEPKVPVLLRVQSSYNDGNQTEPPRASKNASVVACLHECHRAPLFVKHLRDECKRRNLTVFQVPLWISVGGDLQGQHTAVLYDLKAF